MARITPRGRVPLLTGYFKGYGDNDSTHLNTKRFDIMMGTVPTVCAQPHRMSQPHRWCGILLSRNIKGTHFAVGFDRLHHYLPKGAPL
jgi:hypothetical protein